MQQLPANAVQIQVQVLLNLLGLHCCRKLECPAKEEVEEVEAVAHLHHHRSRRGTKANDHSLVSTKMATGVSHP